MRIITLAGAVFGMMLAGFAGAANPGKSPDVIWVDNDFKSIPEPKERQVGYVESAYRSELSQSVKHSTDVPRLVRSVVNAPRQASNVNALDEVPDSSWYTNRHALRPMTTGQLAQGPNRDAPPDFSRGTITNAKTEGVTPGLRVTDATGQSYLIKFDSKAWPELQSGAEVIATKILHAAGYNVPENYIAYLSPHNLTIKPGIEIGQGKSKHVFNNDDLETLLGKVARRPDGTYRVLASKILKGTPKGPFSFVGLRPDDPNDLIPHESRRELRGLRVIASWINHWDMKEINTLDMYVEEGGRKFLRHYLIDFGSSLGGGKTPTEYFHGREYALDKGNALKELFTLGFYVAPDEKQASPIYPEVGLFSAEDFDPGNWKPNFHAVAFSNMTGDDAFWATRIILSLTENDLREIVRTAEYSNPRVTDYVVQTLLARRQQIAERWLKDMNPIGRFAVETGSGGPVLRFDDWMTTQPLAGPARYQYEINSGARHSERSTTTAARIPLPVSAEETQIKIWTIREDTSPRVTVRLQPKPEGGVSIVRIER
jgi:hypothetical protein